MNRCVQLFAFIAMTAVAGPYVGGNPVFHDVFTADPAALVVGDTVYVYVGHDNATEGQFFTMPEWLCYSSKDMKTWTAQGPIMRPEDFKYARANVAWAAHMIEKDGRFYFYTTLRRNNNNEHCIGVAVGDSPTGPFKDARGTPLITDEMTTDSSRPNADIDPTVFLDDDGTAWMMWGNGDFYLVKLKSNMIELDGPIQKVPHKNVAEGPWLFKRGNLYYNVYAADVPGNPPEKIAYATAEKITSPWTYRGLVTGSPKAGFTIHPSVIEFKGQWYFFYHDGSTSLNGIPGGDCRRSVCLEYLYFNDDGTIKSVTQTQEGVSREASSPQQSVQLVPLKDVRLLESPFSQAVQANYQYLLAHDPDRLLAPYRREAGLSPRAKPYGNWESMGLEGHTAGHYLSAISLMIASGADPEGQFRQRLDSMINELDQVQKANGNGYLGGIQGSREFWKSIAEGHVELIGKRWAPWYNLHKMFAGLRDAYLYGGNAKARDLLVGFGDWCETTTSGLTDRQMQQMLGTEYGGMNEVLADIYAITGSKKYLDLAKRFNQRSVFEPLENRQDKLTGMHANTQIPKIIGMQRIAELTNDDTLYTGAAFFWETVVNNRSVAFGGNSVSEHFNNPNDFSGMIAHREGPESCNTYNMLKLTEVLFMAEPKAAYADYYERALYNHILASIHPAKPGYVYFTSIRPDHYRVYSQPEQAFWCCVGTGMENPGKYGAFIYAQQKDQLYVNLFIPSELSLAAGGSVLRQETKFPDEPRTRLRLQLSKPATFTLNIRHPVWVNPGDFAVKVNGRSMDVKSTPSSYAAIRREWMDGDTVDVELPMHLRTERLPDGSNWVAFLYGPIVLAKPDGVENMDGLFADEGRMSQVAQGPTVPLDKVPVLLTAEKELLAHVVPDRAAGPLNFRIMDVIEPADPEGMPLMPFFRLHERRYQMYWELTTAEQVAARKEKLAAEERARLAREAATIDWIAVGEQQPEVEHDLQGEGMETGIHNGRRWRHGSWIQYTLDSRGAKEVILSVTYSGDDRGRQFDILVNGTRIATQRLTGEKPNHFVEKRYTVSSEILQAAVNGRLTVRFAASGGLAGGLYDVRLLGPSAAEGLPFD
ncbi:MAG: beta-L-arabinofuranosidase domain-containing protein [Anaerohalosphaeraceae bacterium]